MARPKPKTVKIEGAPDDLVDGGAPDDELQDDEGVITSLAEVPRAAVASVPARKERPAPIYVAALIDLNVQLTGSLKAPVRLDGIEGSVEDVVVSLLTGGLIEAGRALLLDLVKSGPLRGAAQLHAALLRAGAPVERA